MCETAPKYQNTCVQRKLGHKYRFQRKSVNIREALPGILRMQGEGLFIFRDLGRKVIYFQGFGEKA